MNWHQAFTEKFYGANVGGPNKCQDIHDLLRVSLVYLSSVKFLTGYYRLDHITIWYLITNSYNILYKTNSIWCNNINKVINLFIYLFVYLFFVSSLNLFLIIRNFIVFFKSLHLENRILGFPSTINKLII